MGLLKIEGEVQESLDLGFDDLAALPEQVSDVGTIAPGKEGAGVRLGAVLDRACLSPHATHLTVKSGDGRFSASLPIESLRSGVLVYRLGAEPLPSSKGGPIRFYQDGNAPCHGTEVDACANVKFVSLLRATVGPGEDTRPQNPQTHAALHERPGHEHLKKG